ncbi:dephospho-CoA kinase [Hyphomicrobium denitrificans 1NES1]|uniref:Dephospho-CoA kinase n=1 Tax=Hyphomicrobium denitrificans 1NES1 TaxID=670307 RepID=N0BBI0_9HYPH|nr:dephospho-CoA kinase [Hyphomicrobium denitrificans]AGK59607.1 dephospho-CoA kinase [Hyphomicrobium denitrificans 1NES1]
MLIVGLTGSIGMGKSTAAARFLERGIAVFDADAEAHRLYAGPIAADIERAFPGATVDGKVDRAKLSALLLGKPEKFKELERIVHPKIRAGERRFIQAEHAKGAPIAVLEVPLLFEAGGYRAVDVIVVVSTDDETQRARVLSRSGMSETKFATIRSRQLSEAEKKARADFVVETGGTVENCHSQIDTIIDKLRGRNGEAYDRYWRD